MVGAEVIENMPGSFSPIPSAVFISPLTEVLAGLAGSRIEGDQPGIERAEQNPARAGFARRHAGNGVIGDAPAGGGIGNVLVRHLRIVAPAFRASGRVGGDRDAFRGAEIKRIADLERRGLGTVSPLGRLARQVAGMEHPGAGEPGRVGRRDLIKRRVAPRAVGAAISRPVGAGREGRRVGHRQRGSGQGMDLRLRCQHRHPVATEYGKHENAERGAGSGDPAKSVTQDWQCHENEDQKHERSDDARHQRPAVEPRFPERPDERQRENAEVDNRAALETAVDREAGGQSPIPASR